MGRISSDNHAVSETMGYILIFAIMLTGIAIILITGNSVLNTAKSQNNFKSIEQGLSVVQSNLKQVALEGTPVKTTRVHLEGGTITTVNSSNRLVVLFNGYSYNNSTGNITFMSNTDPGMISIENGGLWEKSDFNSSDVEVLKPRIYYVPDTGTLVVNVIRLNNSYESVGGSATVDVDLQYRGTSVYNWTSGTPANATITFQTAYPRAWYRYLNDSLWIPPYQSTVSLNALDNRSFTVTIPNVSNLIISEHNVSVSIY